MPLLLLPHYPIRLLHLPRAHPLHTLLPSLAHSLLTLLPQKHPVLYPSLHHLSLYQYLSLYLIFPHNTPLYADAPKPLFFHRLPSPPPYIYLYGYEGLLPLFHKSKFFLFYNTPPYGCVRHFLLSHNSAPYPIGNNHLCVRAPLFHILNYPLHHSSLHCECALPVCRSNLLSC